MAKKGKALMLVIGGPGDKESDEKENESVSEEFTEYAEKLGGSKKKQRRNALRRLNEVANRGSLYENPEYNPETDPRSEAFADEEYPEYTEYLRKKVKGDIKKYYKNK